MTRTKQHIQERMDELAVSYERYNEQLDFPNAEIAMASILELTDVLVILESELDGFKPKHND